MKTWKPFFIWKGIRSLDMGLEVIRLPPLVRPEQRVNEITVPGRHGVLHITDGSYASIVKTVEIGTLVRETDRLFNWLRGSGDVVFSNAPRRKYEAAIINKIPLEQVIRQIRKGQVIFDCQPFQYEVRQSPVEIAAGQVSSCIVTNIGTMESEPVLTVYGQGDMTVSINGRTFKLIGVQDYAIIDSRIMCAYRTESQLMNQNMSGDFPVFDVGENIVSWTGSITKITILPYWRWL